MFSPIQEYEALQRHNILINEANRCRSLLSWYENHRSLLFVTADRMRTLIAGVCGWCALRLRGGAERFERASLSLSMAARRPHGAEDAA